MLHTLWKTKTLFFERTVIRYELSQCKHLPFKLLCLVGDKLQTKVIVYVLILNSDIIKNYCF